MWLEDGVDVVCRHTLTGHSGEGIEIVFAENGNVVPPAPLYTQYVKKRSEYRVHFIKTNDGVKTLIQQKRRNFQVDNPDWKVRNYENGFIYSVENVTDTVADIRRLAIVASGGLDFGAVDIMIASRSDYNQNILNIEEDSAIALEVNTAPGIISPTVLGFYEQQLTIAINELKERLNS